MEIQSSRPSIVSRVPSGPPPEVGPRDRVTIGLVSTPFQEMRGVLMDYRKALEVAGARVETIILDGDVAAAQDRVDGLLIPGGRPVDPGLYGETPATWLGRVTPESDAACKGMIARAFETRMPMLGICKGMHMLNVSAGGSLVQDIEANLSEREHRVDHGPYGHGLHPVQVESRIGRRKPALLKAVKHAELEVKSSHRQTLKAIPSMFAVTAAAPDGIAEAIERRDCPSQWGVQFHPEKQRKTDPRYDGIFKTLVRDARAWRKQRDTIAS